MLTLITQLQKLNVKNILYVHESGTLNIDLLDVLNSISKDIWIVVLTTDTSVDRLRNRTKFDVVYSTYQMYKPWMRFDVGFVPRSSYEDYLLNKKCVKNVVTTVPMNEYIEYTSVYEVNKEFYVPHTYLTWLPLSIQEYLSKYKLFADKSIKFLMGSFNENRN